MSTFLPYSILLLCLALLFVIVPVLRYRPVARQADSEIRRQKNIQVFEQSLRELEQDAADGLVQAEDFERLKTELQRGFLRDMADEDKRERRGSAGKVSKLVPVLSLLFVTVFSYTLYDSVGSVRDLGLKDIMAELSSAETQETQLASLEKLAAFLQDRFDRHDDDIQNGYMLGTLYLELQDYPAAIATFRSLAGQLEPGEDKATVLGQLAQALYLAADSQMTDQVQDVVNQALALNPNEYAIMSILAIEAIVQEDFGRAVSYWRRQLMQLDASTQQAATLRNRIAQVEALLGETGTEVAAANNASVDLVIDLDPAVRNLVDAGMTLYVFARREAGGPPVAARNLSVGDFPFSYTLDDSMAMIAGNNLSSADRIVVGARLSRSGNPVAQPGDIQAISEPFDRAGQDQPVHLLISEIVQ